MIVLVILVWIILSFCLALCAKKKGHSNILFFFAGLFFTPIIGFLLLLVIGENKMRGIKILTEIEDDEDENEEEFIDEKDFEKIDENLYIDKKGRKWRKTNETGLAAAIPTYGLSGITGTEVTESGYVWELVEED